METVITNAGKERLIESFNSLLQDNLQNFIGEAINTKAISDHVENMLSKFRGISVGFRTAAWQAIDWSTESTRRHVWLTALGSEGQTKNFRFRSLRLARVYAKRSLPSMVFCDLSYTPLRPAEFITINVSLDDLQLCAT